MVDAIAQKYKLIDGLYVTVVGLQGFRSLKGRPSHERRIQVFYSVSFCFPQQFKGSNPSQFDPIEFYQHLREAAQEVLGINPKQYGYSVSGNGIHFDMWATEAPESVANAAHDSGFLSLMTQGYPPMQYTLLTGEKVTHEDLEYVTSELGIELGIDFISNSKELS